MHNSTRLGEIRTFFCEYSLQDLFVLRETAKEVLINWETVNEADKFGQVNEIKQFLDAVNLELRQRTYQAKEAFISAFPSQL